MRVFKLEEKLLVFLFARCISQYLRTGAARCDSMDKEDDSSGREDSSTDTLVASVLQGSQAAPGVVNDVADTAVMTSTSIVSSKDHSRHT